MPSLALLRQKLRAHRRALDAQVRQAAAEAVAERLLALPGAPSHGYVAGYWAVDGELPLSVWQVRLPATCRYCLPVLDTHTRRLRFAPLGTALRPNRYGIPEPQCAPEALLDAAELALIVLPLTGFDAACHRLGMGGGWYDRTLAGLPAGAPMKVGVGFDAQEVATLTPAPWDVPCDAIITETRTILPSA